MLRNAAGYYEVLPKKQKKTSAYQYIGKPSSSLHFQQDTVKVTTQMTRTIDDGINQTFEMVTNQAVRVATKIVANELDDYLLYAIVQHKHMNSFVKV